MSKKKPNIKCHKCGHQWRTKSKLKMVTCPSCNQKIPNIAIRRHLIKELIVQRRGIIGLEAAIVLIAFVIIAAAFSFMVVNQGLFATEKGKTAIQEGLKQASTPLSMDGTIFLRSSSDATNVTAVIIPLRAYGVKYVAMGTNQTVVTLKIGSNAWANIYDGVSITDPTGKNFTELVSEVSAINATLFIENSNGDEALDAYEKGYLTINLGDANGAAVRAQIIVEIRLEKTAPLSIEFTVPEAMSGDTWITG